MRNHFLFTVTVLAILGLHGCGGGGGGASAGTTAGNTAYFSTDEKRFVHTLFQTEYLWFEDVTANIDYDMYDTPQALVDALRVDPPDRWSLAITAQEFEDYANQKTAGFGFGYLVDTF